MNKDVYYIEPEDDITDIITRLKASSQKVVALVPPKKVSVLRSVINLKLIAKTAKTMDKAIVIVTLDPALMKMSASVGLPFSKSLQSRPVLPSEFKADKVKSSGSNSKKTMGSDSETILNSDADLDSDLSIESDIEIDQSDKDISSADQTATPGKTDHSNLKTRRASAQNTENNQLKSPKSTSIKVREKNKLEDDALRLDSEELEPEEKMKTKNRVKKIPNFDKMQKWIILGVLGVILLVVLGVWAFVFAPAAKISVKIKTTPDNFSENILFATSAETASNKEGRILLESESLEKEASVEFEATGERNDGDRATGKLTVTANFNFSTSSASASSPEKITIPSGSAFAKGALNFLTTDTTEFSWDGSVTGCTSRVNDTCQVRKTINVIAFEGGAKYNVDASATNWQSSVNHVDAFNSSAFSGGTDKITKIVTQQDVEKAKTPLEQIEDGKEELFARVKDSEVRIDTSFKKTLGNIISTPNIGEAVSGGKAKLSTRMTYKVNVVDKSAIEEYVKTIVGSRLGEDQKIYEINSFFVERFQEGSGASAKIKATVKTGPEVTEKTVLDKSLGKKVGEVTTLIKSINGVSEVKINTSFPWVRNVPNDANRVSISISVEENN